MLFGRNSGPRTRQRARIPTAAPWVVGQAAANVRGIVAPVNVPVVTTPSTVTTVLFVVGEKITKKKQNKKKLATTTKAG